MSDSKVIKGVLVDTTAPVKTSTIYVPRPALNVCRTPASNCEMLCSRAISCGYRHINTSQESGNEAEIGEAVRKSGIPREDFFLAIKVSIEWPFTGETYENIIESVDKFGGIGGYVDLILIETLSDSIQMRCDMWHTLEHVLKDGKTKGIGVSDYTLDPFLQIGAYSKIGPPHVVQLETLDFEVAILALKYNKTPHQILIRYSLQKGWVPLLSSTNPDHIMSNMDVFDFALTEEDMIMLDWKDDGTWKGD